MSQIKKGLPHEGTLDPVVVEKDVFMFLAKGITKHLDITILIRLKESKAKVNVRITNIYPPGSVGLSISGGKSIANYLPKTHLSGVNRASEELFKNLFQQSWQLYGTTLDSTERPICIIVLEDISSVYAFKKDDEKPEEFNPHLN